MKNLLLVLLALMISGGLRGQEQDVIITINPFSSNEYPKDFKIKYNSTVKVKINNVNPFVAKGNVDIFTTNVDYNLEQTIAGIKRPPYLESSIVAKDSSNTPLKKYIDDKFPKKHQEFISAYMEVLNLLSTKEEMDDYIHKAPLIKDPALFIKQIEAFALLFEDIEKYYNNLEEKYGNLSKANEDTKQYYYQKWDDAQLKREEAFSEKTIKKISVDRGYINQQLSIARTADYYYLTDAIQIRDDKVVITPRIYSKNGNEILHTFSDLTISPIKKIRINFSAGYLLSFIGDEEYGLRYSNDKAIGVTELDKNNFSHALGLLTHVLYDFGTSVDYGISTGLSLNTDAKINFYGGLSTAFTQENRMVITAGLSFVNLKLLNKTNLNDELNFTSSNTEIHYLEKYRSAFFVGITYNFKK